jgi:outer membrane immunogenic protein
MKKLAVALCALAATTVAASAADMPMKAYTKAPAVVVPVMSWTGFYIGAEGGYGWGRDNFNFPVSLTTTNRFDTSGGIAGGVVGFNWQAPGTNWVFGVEGNFDWANIRGSAPCPNPAFSCRSNLNEIFTGTGRIGYAWSSVLLYAKGGYAWTNDRSEAVIVATQVVGETANRVGRDGYTVGAGAEWMFAPSWSAKVEYDYYSFDTKAVNFNTPAGVFVEPVSLARYSVNAIKAGINYHFNWGGPVVAKY